MEWPPATSIRIASARGQAPLEAPDGVCKEGGSILFGTVIVRGPAVESVSKPSVKVMVPFGSTAKGLTSFYS